MATPRGQVLLLVVIAAMWAVSERPAAADLVVSSTPLPPSTTAPTTTPRLPESATEGNAAASRPDVYSLHVTSRITHRYARTVVSSRLANRAADAQEAQFSLVLPETAFISAFLIETEGKVYEAYVKEKEEAKKEYDAALASGQTAAHVAVSARDANTFNVAVNVAPGQKVTFNLTYEELLARRLGAYSHAVHVAPGQVVRDLRVEVLIEESRNLSALPPPAFRPADAELDADANDADAADRQPATPGLTTERLGGGKARVVFAPTPDQQREIAAALAAKDTEPKRPFHAARGSAGEGLVGQLVVQYDVERDPRGGEVLLDQGYFVHFFAPDELPPLPKHVIFVLDVSGSMEGRKVQQLKEAMTTILGDLKPGDYFNLLEFSYSVTVWNLDSASNNVVYSPYSHTGPEKPAEPPAPAAYPASAEYVQKAKEIVRKMTAGGGTNIHDALRTALAVARDGLRDAHLPDAAPRPEPIVVFLTDGEPTVGESRPHKIFQMVSERNEHPTCALFSLAFGDDADLPFLKKLSLRNAGFARKIYEAADAALQLRNFYRQVASPLLSNVTFEYASEDAPQASVTKKRFPTYFAGSELVVAGRVGGSGTPVGGAVVARGGAGEARFPVPEPLLLLPHPHPHPHPPTPTPPEPTPGSKKQAPSLERLWAYLSIRQLLDEREANSGFEDQFADADAKANLTEAQQQARDAADAAKKRALQLALQYSFVTPLTSLVVVKPNGTSAADLEGARPPGGGSPFFGGGGGFAASALGAGGAFAGGAGGVAHFAQAFPASAGFAPGQPGAPPPLAARPTFLPPSTPLYLTTRPPAPPPPVSESHAAEQATSTGAPSPSPSPSPSAPALGTLSDLTWLTNALNGTTGSLLVPLANGTRLLRLGVNEVGQRAPLSLPPPCLLSPPTISSPPLSSLPTLSSPPTLSPPSSPLPLFSIPSHPLPTYHPLPLSHPLSPYPPIPFHPIIPSHSLHPLLPLPPLHTLILSPSHPLPPYYPLPLSHPLSPYSPIPSHPIIPSQSLPTLFSPSPPLHTLSSPPNLSSSPALSPPSLPSFSCMSLFSTLLLP